jgi:hypothetical protein
MTTNELNKLFDENWKLILELTRSKGADYASDLDRLSNFKDNARKLGMTQYQIWGVYANKHWDAINAFIKNDGQLESEPIESRIHDIIVYSLLLLGLIQDKTKETPNETARTRKR